MSEKGTIEKVKAREGLFSRIQNIFTAGYSTKEDLRELDKQLRDFYYEDLRELRHQWEKVYLEALEPRQTTLGRSFKTVIQTMDRVSEQINRADYGYAGLWDRKGSIKENELAGVFDSDKALGAEIDEIKKGVEKVQSAVTGGEWKEVAAGVETLKQSLRQLESKWKDREKLFRPLSV